MDIERNDNYASGYAPACQPYTYTKTNSNGEIVESGTISGNCEIAYTSNGKWTLVQVLIANAMFNGAALSFAPVQDFSPTLNTKEGV